jgi:uncharacterized iron-regulated membrane protein
MQRGALRKIWFQAHLWLGVALFLVFIPLGITGSLLVWRDATDALFNGERYAVAKAAPTRPLADYVVSAQAVVKPGERITSVRLPEHKGPVVVTAVKPPKGGPGRPQQHAVWLDPATAKVAAEGAPLKGVVKFAHDFHGHLLIPGLGRKIVGWLGWAMLISSLTGIWLWWPRNGPVSAGFRWRRSSLTTANLHHMTGIWVAVPLAVLSATGIWISFPDSAKAVAAPFAGKAAPQPGGRGFAPPLEKTRLNPDRAAAVALAGRDGYRLASVAWPTKRQAYWRVQVRKGGEPQEFRVDDATGAVAAAPSPKGTDAVARLFRRIHGGEGLTPVWAVLTFLAGLAPALLGVTGVWMWLAQRGRRRALERTRLG